MSKCPVYPGRWWFCKDSQSLRYSATSTWGKRMPRGSAHNEYPHQLTAIVSMLREQLGLWPGFPLRKVYTGQVFVLVSMDIIRRWVG